MESFSNFYHWGCAVGKFSTAPANQNELSADFRKHRTIEKKKKRWPTLWKAMRQTQPFLFINISLTKMSKIDNTSNTVLRKFQ